MRKLKALMVLLLVISFVSGCSNPVYINNIDKAYSKLKVGMTTSELNDVFGGFKLIKEQIVTTYPNSSVKDMRISFKNDKSFEEVYPENILSTVSLDGNVKVYSYFVKNTPEWPNGWRTSYILVFVDNRSGKVIGWARDSGLENSVKNWPERF